MRRRNFLQLTAGGAAWAVAGSPRPGRAEPGLRQLNLVARPGRQQIAPDGYPDTAVWRYGDSVPGPEIRIRQGERLRVVVDNGLDQDTTIHWHGIRLPNAMDGVPGLTQEPIQPGERFVYEFTPPDAGTYWYHPHVNGVEQQGRGLYGALIVEEPEPPVVDRDVTWVLDDWRMDREAEIVGNFRDGHDMSHAGRIGNTVTLNGRVPDAFSIRPGERLRLRLLNVSNARNFALRFEEHDPVIVAIDGQPVQPHEPAGGTIVLGAAMRVDLMLDCTRPPESETRVIDVFYPDRAFVLTTLRYGPEPPIDGAFVETPRMLPANPLGEPDRETATRHEMVLAGGAMGGLRGATLDGQWADMAKLVEEGVFWAMSGTARRPDDFESPLFVAERDSSHVLSLVNRTAFPHPMHLHGHHFRVLSRDGNTEPHTPWSDTVLVMPREQVEIAFRADNPGKWLFHCHVLEHMAAGMSGVIRVM